MNEEGVDLWLVNQPPLPGMPEAGDGGIVYFFWDGRLYVKIGYTARPIKRRGGELHAIEIMHIPGTRLLEKQLHHRYSSLRMGSSEWFWPADPLMRDLFWLAGKLEDQRAYALLCKIERAGTWKPGRVA